MTGVYLQYFLEKEKVQRVTTRVNTVHIAHAPSGAPRTLNVVAHFQENTCNSLVMMNGRASVRLVGIRWEN